jgi:hypothetical protein
MICHYCERQVTKENAVIRGLKIVCKVCERVKEVIEKKDKSVNMVI